MLVVQISNILFKPSLMNFAILIFVEVTFVLKYKYYIYLSLVNEKKTKNERLIVVKPT